MAYKQEFGKAKSDGTGAIFMKKGLISPMHNDEKKKKKKKGIQDATEPTTTIDNTSGKETTTSSGGYNTTSGQRNANNTIKISQKGPRGESLGASTKTQKEINASTDIPAKPQKRFNTANGVNTVNSDGSETYQQYSQNKNKMLSEKKLVRQDSIRVGNRNASSKAFNTVINSFKNN